MSISMPPVRWQSFLTHLIAGYKVSTEPLELSNFILLTSFCIIESYIFNTDTSSITKVLEESLAFGLILEVLFQRPMYNDSEYSIVNCILNSMLDCTIRMFVETVTSLIIESYEFAKMLIKDPTSDPIYNDEYIEAIEDTDENLYDLNTQDDFY